ncbi:BspA family leucine-rich repeat surface protein [Succinimonas amylolytica]|uniref:BspA family leucine-rich repeat surface protein n=1 Tax=Succinimonas amylolytica TaxID=83769 RepID=UPI0023A83E53
MKPVQIFLRKLSLALLSGLILAALCSCSTSAKDYHNQKSAFQYDTAGDSQSKSDNKAPEYMKDSETDFMLGYFREIRAGNLPAALSEKTLTGFNDTGKDLLYSIEKHTLKKLVIAYDLGPAPEKRSPFARICQVTDRMDFEIVFAKEVTSLYGLFEGCRLSALPKNLDTSRITDMSRMFARTEIKTTFPELDTGNAVKMTAMFAGASFMSRGAPNLN